MKKNKPFILLINPFIYDFTAFDLWAKPLGFLEIGRNLKELGCEIELIDCLYQKEALMEKEAQENPKIYFPQKKKYGTGSYFKEEIPKLKEFKNFPRRYYRFGFTPKVFQQKLKQLKRKPDLILVTSGMTYWWEGVRDTIKIAKGLFPKIPIILGGIYASLLPLHAFKNIKVEEIYTGTLLRKRELIYLLKRYLPKWEANSDYYNNYESPFYPYLEIEYAIIRTSIGCPRHCTYCASKIINPSFFQLSPQKISEDIIFYYQRGIKHFAFYDDFLLFNKENHLFPIIKKVFQKTKGDIFFHTPNGLFMSDIDEKTALFLRNHNFITLRFGFETSNFKLSKSTGFKISLAHFSQKVKILKKAGYQTKDLGVYLLMGLPEQTPQDVEKSIDFVKQSGAKPYLAEFSPVPGTLEYEKMKKISLINFEKNPTLQNKTLLPLRSPVFDLNTINQLKNYCYQNG